MSDKFIGLVAEVASAFFASNHLPAAEVPNFLKSLRDAFAALDKPVPIVPDRPKPAVDLPWKKTIRPEYLISLIDGKQYKTLRRHVATHGLTPDEYRARYDLPRDYPMVAAAYSERRSALARAAGLGQQGRRPDATAAAEQADKAPGAAPIAAAATSPAPTDDPAPAKRRRGRPAKVAAAA